MDRLWRQLGLVDVQGDLLRNIVSLRVSQDLFDDLTEDPAEAALAQQVELQAKPAVFQSAQPVIHRPFEDARWSAAIGWPFAHWQASRFGDGRFGVWYGAESVETTVHESAYHWWSGLLRDAGWQQEDVVGERRVYRVACAAALLDFRPVAAREPRLVHGSDYGFTQAVGARIHHEGHPGIVNPSVRRPGGETYAIFNPAVLADPRAHCELTYRLHAGRITVDKKPGRRWLSIDPTGLGW